ncbi:MAG: response regulator [Verrucomicrobiales bacterium]|nr:response regulator transcription factor [Verrucomicrobiota bacterium JB025]
MAAPSETDTETPLQIAVIEDDRTTRTILEALIDKTPGMQLCGSWEQGEDAIANLCSLNPDVVIVDLELPGISGDVCIRALSAVLTNAAFVVLTVHEDPDRVFEALRAGANGYLLKGSSPDEIIAGLRAAHRGGSPLSPEIANLVIRAFQKTPEKKPAMPLPSLSPREHQILELLSTGLAPKEVAAELAISYETVRDYLKRIYQKLHVRSKTEAVLRFLNAKRG